MTWWAVTVNTTARYEPAHLELTSKATACQAPMAALPARDSGYLGSNRPAQVLRLATVAGRDDLPDCPLVDFKPDPSTAIPTGAST
jgi:hypothetical protein